MGQSITLQGWVRTNRNSKAVGFIALNDGTTFSNVQVVYADSLENFDEVIKNYNRFSYGSNRKTCMYSRCKTAI